MKGGGIGLRPTELKLEYFFVWRSGKSQNMWYLQKFLVDFDKSGLNPLLHFVHPAERLISSENRRFSELTCDPENEVKG